MISCLERCEVVKNYLVDINRENQRDCHSEDISWEIAKLW